MLKTQTLGPQCAVEFDDESRWVAILITGGPRLNFAPESVQRLRNLLDQNVDHSVCGISESYIASLEDEWLRLIAYRRDNYDFLPVTTELLKSFLNEVLGPPIERDERDR